MSDEARLLWMVRNSANPERALETAIDVIIDFLTLCQMKEAGRGQIH